MADPDNPVIINKTKSEKMKRLQLMARVQALIGDEHKAGQVISQMDKLQKERRDALLQGRDFLMANVEKASVWPEISAHNLQMRGAGWELEQ